MALVVKDRVQETTTTTGTGTITLAGAVTGFQSFSVIGNGNTTYYSITGGAQWEIGIGTYTASGTTLSRDTVLESSNSGSLVDFSAGTKTVFCTYPAERSMYVDGTTITPATTATLPITSGGTGQSSLTANNVILGNGTSAVQFVAPGTSANVLTSNGTTWVSQAAGGGAQDFDLVVNYTFSGASATALDIPNIPTTAGSYILVGSVLVNSSTAQMNMSFRCSINNGSTFYTASTDYGSNGSGSNGPQVISATNRASAFPGKITLFFSFSQASGSGIASDTLTMITSGAVWAPAACGGLHSSALLNNNTFFRASTSPVNAFRLYVNSGAATYTDGYIRIYKLATS